MIRFLYRAFRRLHSWCIAHPRSFITTGFFSLLPLLLKLFTARKDGNAHDPATKIWKALYFAQFSREKPPFVLRTAHEVALETSDSKHPKGAMYNNSLNQRFNLKLYRLFGYDPQLAVLDLGCSGGGFVRSILEDGYRAVGLEGSPISQQLQSGEWGVAPLHLFTCDITKPFQIEDGQGDIVRFHAITAWEVLEHIPEEDLPMLMQNIKSALKEGGLFIASVATFPDADPLTGAVYHSTLRPREWWVERFATVGLREIDSHPFEDCDWVRGSGRQLFDWHPSDGCGFHLVLV